MHAQLDKDRDAVVFFYSSIGFSTRSRTLSLYFYIIQIYLISYLFRC